MSAFWKNYKSTLLLLAGVTLGALCGIFWPSAADVVKPVGDIFLNLIFMMVVPLVFFSTASSICKLRGSGMLGRVLLIVLAVFLGMSVIATLVGWLGVVAWPVADAGAIKRLMADVNVSGAAAQDNSSVAGAIVGALTASDFSLILSKDHLLALIVFAALFGYSVGAVAQKGRPMEAFIFSGTDVMMKMVSLVMVLAPVGLGCYFAHIISAMGAEMLGGYLKVFVLYVALTLLFFLIINSLYVLAASGWGGLRIYWKELWEPVVTAVATVSSAATMPSAISAVKRMGVAPEIAESVIPLGTNIHKDGSVMGAVFKIAFLMLLLGRPVTGGGTLLMILAVALMEALVLSAVPSGGLTGEVFICAVMGFDPSMVGLIVMVGMIIDVPATLLNVNGNIVGAVLVDRIAKRFGKKDEMLEIKK